MSLTATRRKLKLQDLHVQRYVDTTFNYWASDEIPDPSQTAAVFHGTSPHVQPASMSVQDIRPWMKTFNLDQHAFQVMKHESALLYPQTSEDDQVDFLDSRLVKRHYWPEIVALVKEQLGARSAVVVNTTVRDEMSPENVLKADPRNPRANPRTAFNPFFVVHGDYDPISARTHIRAIQPNFFEENGSSGSVTQEEQETFFHLREQVLDAEDTAVQESGASDLSTWSGSNYNGPRCMILSVWRPVETVRRDPLAMLDIGSEYTYSELRRIYENRPGCAPAFSSTTILPNKPAPTQRHQWYYVSEQQPDEVIALKLFDSDAYKQGSSVSKCVIHSAFPVNGTQHLPPRRSVELRVIAIF